MSVVRSSKFRHVFGKTVRKEEQYENVQVGAAGRGRERLGILPHGAPPRRRAPRAPARVSLSSACRARSRGAFLVRVYTDLIAQTTRGSTCCAVQCVCAGLEPA